VVPVKEAKQSGVVEGAVGMVTGHMDIGLTDIGLTRTFPTGTTFTFLIAITFTFLTVITFTFHIGITSTLLQLSSRLGMALSKASRRSVI